MRIYLVLLISNLHSVSIPLDLVMIVICLMVVVLFIRKEVKI